MSKRSLRFSSFDDVIQDVNQLKGNYLSHGNWDLGQIAEHLADWLSYPMEGYPKAPWFIAILLTAMRVLQGKQLYARFVRDQRMAENQPTMPATIHSKSGNEEDSIARLIEMLNRLKNYRGPLHTSPLYGKLNYDETVALHLAHCAHHLNFLEPRENGKGGWD